MMKHSHAENQASLLVELLLNDPVMKLDLHAEIEKVIYENASDRTKLAYAVYEKINAQCGIISLRELLNSLSERGEITVLSIDNAANEIMINWCGMVGCIIYRSDRNTWEMHT